jgi:Uma2 family endonuclease
MSGGDNVNPRLHQGSDERTPDTPVRDAATDLKLTYDDFLLFPDDGQRHELIDGEHHVTPSPDIRHQRILRELLYVITDWLKAHPVGEMFTAPLDVILSRHDVVEPDLLYVSKERAAALLSGQHVTGAPDLVVEIASTGTRRRDETIKRRLYERMGVTEYWVVDPDIDVIRVYTRTDDRFGRPAELSAERGDVLRTPLLAGLDIPLARVFVE